MGKFLITIKILNLQEQYSQLPIALTIICSFSNNVQLSNSAELPKTLYTIPNTIINYTVATNDDRIALRSTSANIIQPTYLYSKDVCTLGIQRHLQSTDPDNKPPRINCCLHPANVHLCHIVILKYTALVCICI
jgi:hypothetical protein